MALQEGSPYRVDPVGTAKQQMVDLIARATALGQRQEVLTALKSIIDELETRPLEWGDPEHRTHQEGGRVYHGIAKPLIARYAAFEAEKVVFLFDVRALPHSPLPE